MSNVIQPKLRFPEFKENWYERKLSDLLTFKNGINASKEDYGSGYKFINVLDIIQNDFITHDRIIGSVKIDESEFKKNIVEYGDILFQRSSETREEVGQANVYLDKDVPATFGGFVIRGKKIIDYDPEFMNAVLKTSRSRKEITSKSGGSTRYNVGQDTLSEVIIYIPDLNEQQKIASYLRSIDDHITLLKRKKTALERYKDGVMQQIFSQKIRFKDENGNDFPDWEERTLGEICEKTSSNISANSLEDNEGEYKIFGATGFLKTINFYREETDYISIVKDGAGVGRILFCEGKTSVLGTLDILKPKVNIDINFLFALISNIQFEKYATGSTIPHIYFKDYSKEKMNVPSLIEQQKISRFLATLNTDINLVNKELEQTTVFKMGLLQKMFV